MTVTKKTSWSDLNTIATPEFMARIETADRFTKERVGQSYTIGDIIVSEYDNKTVIERVAVRCGYKYQEWYLKAFLKYIRVSHNGIPMTIPQWCHETSNPPFTSFKVTGFTPDVDDFGHSIYSREIQDPIKKAKLFPEEMRRLEAKEMTISERIAFNNLCNRRVLELAYDSYLVNGQISEEAAKKFQLGILTVVPV